MKKVVITFIFTVAIIALFSSSCSQKGSSVTEESMVGDWYTLKGDVGSISFIKDDTSKTFTNFLHDRPFMYGKWEIKNNKLIRTMDDGTSTSFNLLLISDTLTLNDGTEIYTRTVPFEVQHPEIGILFGLSSELSLKITEPQPAEFSWTKSPDESSASSETVILKGYEASFNTLKEVNDRTSIIGYLENNGFKYDTLSRELTESAVFVTYGFWKDLQLVTLSTVFRDDKTDNEEITISIRSGIIIK